MKDMVPDTNPRLESAPIAVRPIRSVLTALGPSGQVDVVVVIPARNEQWRITACLEALTLAIAKVQPVVTAVCIVVNNSDDGTCQQVMLWALQNSQVPVQVIDCQLSPEQAHAGAARRIGLDLSLRRLGPQGVLMTTDADSRVRPDWIAANLTALAQADLVCGAFAADVTEAGRLPPAVAMHCHVETAYMSVAVQLAALLDPRAHDPDPPHLNASGASLAFTRRLYEAVGGMPVVEMSEDRAFAALAERHDFRVRHCTTAMVDTSCRMTGRTSGGMAGALRERAVEPDPLVDQWLEPAAAFVRRYHLRGRLRAVWPDPSTLRAELAAVLGREEARCLMTDPLPETFGAFIEWIEAQASALARVRMRMSDCRGELPRLIDLHAAYADMNRSAILPERMKRRAQ